MPRRPSPRAAALTGLTGAAAASLGLAALGLAGPGEALPDLTPELPVPDQAQLVVGAAGHRLLRFDAVLRNAGPGRLELVGTPAGGAGLAAEQRIYDASDETVTRTRSLDRDMTFEDGDGHHHWHMLHAARYSLWTPGAGGHEVAPSAKVGFCLVDSYSFGSASSSYYTDDCVPQPGSGGAVTMGISPTWGDLYSRYLAFQWIDVTGVAPGPYRLRADADPDDQIEESDEENQVAWADVFVPGLVARAVELPEGGAGEPRAIDLGAEAVNAPSTPPDDRLVVRFYQVLQAPAHGTLSDVDATDPRVVYTPDPGYAGPDRFTYRAYDNGTGVASDPATVTLSTAAAGPGAGSSAGGAAGAAGDAAGASTPARTSLARTARRPALTVRATWTGPRRITATVRARSAGRAVLVARAGGRAVARCAMAVPAGRTVTCRMTTSGRRRAHLVVSATLRGAGTARIVARSGAIVHSRAGAGRTNL